MESMVFSLGNYENYDDMMFEVGKFLATLVKNDYEVAVYKDGGFKDPKFVVVEFDHKKDLGFGNQGLYWLYPEEMDEVWNLRQEKNDVHD